MAAQISARCSQFAQTSARCSVQLLRTDFRSLSSIRTDDFRSLFSSVASHRLPLAVLSSHRLPLAVQFSCFAQTCAQFSLEHRTQLQGRSLLCSGLRCHTVVACAWRGQSPSPAGPTGPTCIPATGLLAAALLPSVPSPEAACAGNERFACCEPPPRQCWRLGLRRVSLHVHAVHHL